MSNESKKELALSHLEKKYGKTFEIVSFAERNIDMPYDELVTKDKDGQTFYTYIESIDGENIVRDGYYGVLKSADYKKIVGDVIDQYLTDYKLFTYFTASYFDNQYDKDYELAAALKTTPVQFYTYTYIFISNKTAGQLQENIYEELAQALQKQDLTLHLAVYCVSDDAFLAVDESQDVNLFISDDYRDGPVFRKTIQ